MSDQIKILMIDDQEDFLEPMAFWLRSKGHNTITVTSGEEGVNAVEEEKPDIIFLDIFMPGMNGVQTLEEIRKVNKDIPVIMLTSAVVENVKDAYSVEELDRLGVSGFFKKKDSFEDLSRLLDVALRHHKKIKTDE